MRIVLSIAVLMILAAGCSGYKPRPEGFGPVNEAKAEERNSYSVHHTVKGNKVYIECFVREGRFGRNEKEIKAGELYITVSVDGKAEMRQFVPAFSMVLDKGYHELALTVHKHKEDESLRKPYIWTVKTGG
ncbi:hypothetical protein GKZ89_04235 [Bacillus mangrovi]|uniref:Uncharacterized protein n=1 Tax=Metabacillus mangrovi TaxID=1491830 RepID=A0A7X2V408_9BACI|nr:hypothetical protein [Metabacillus mangrovi]MTH52606.1 hypothetical protein [Metabacillus mangrovi]